MSEDNLNKESNGAEKSAENLSLLMKQLVPSINSVSNSLQKLAGDESKAASSMDAFIKKAQEQAAAMARVASGATAQGRAFEKTVSVLSKSSSAIDGIGKATEAVGKKLKKDTDEAKKFKLEIKSLSSVGNLIPKTSSNSSNGNTNGTKNKTDSNAVLESANKQFEATLEVAEAATDVGNAASSAGKAVSKAGKVGKALGAIGDIAGMVSPVLGAVSGVIEVAGAVAEIANAEKNAKKALGLDKGYLDSLDAAKVKYKDLNEEAQNFLKTTNADMEQRKEASRSLAVQANYVHTLTENLAGMQKVKIKRTGQDSFALDMNTFEARSTLAQANSSMPGLDLDNSYTLNPGAYKSRNDFFISETFKQSSYNQLSKNKNEAEYELENVRSLKENAEEALKKTDLSSDEKKNLKSLIKVYTGTITELSNEVDLYTTKIDEQKESLSTAKDSMEAYDKTLFNHEDALGAIVQSYEESYNAALSMIKGRFGFDQEVTTIGTGGMSAVDLLTKSAEGIDSQTAFSTTNKENFEKISGFKDVDFSSDMISDIFSQGEYGASIAAAIAKLIDVSKSNDSSEEDKASALATLKDYNTSYEARTKAQDSEAKTLGLIDSDFEGQIEALKGQMMAFFGALTVEDGTLQKTAKSNIDSLIEGFNSQAKNVAVAGGDLANAIIQKFRKAYEESGITFPLKEQAIGTTNAPNVFLAGEEGPEIVVGAGGSRVFTAGATSDILSRAYGEAVTSVEASNRVYSAVENNNVVRHETNSNKTITLKIEGGNSITVDVNGFKEQFVDMLSENLRPVLVNIIEEDIFEEGEGSYNF